MKANLKLIRKYRGDKNKCQDNVIVEVDRTSDFHTVNGGQSVMRERTLTES
jgi:hypothetical protein